MYRLDNTQVINLNAVAAVKVVEQADKKAILHVYLLGGHVLSTLCPSVEVADNHIVKMEMSRLL